MADEKEYNSEETPVKEAPKEKNYNIVFFIIILILSIIGISAAYIHNTNDFNKRQNNIIVAQNIQISRIDSALSKFYSHSINLKNDSLCYNSITDTLKEAKYNSQSKIDSITLAVIRASIKAGATKELADQLRKDSVFVHSQIGQIQNDTKSLLTLEFNKIQNEYQELQLWGGILTIVFLIFTFYSLFKTDDLMKQGRDGLKDIQKIKNDSELIVEKTKTEQKLISEQFESLKAQISDIEKSKNLNETKIRELGENIEEKRLAFDESLKLNNEVTTLRKQIAQLSIDVISLRTLYDSIGEKEEQSEISDDSQIEESAHEENEADETFEDNNDEQEPKQ